MSARLLLAALAAALCGFGYISPLRFAEEPGGGAMVGIPPPPVSIDASTSTSTDGNYAISWDGVEIATDYFIERRKRGGKWGDGQRTRDTTRVWTGTTPGVYEHRVQACNAQGCSDWTEGAVVTVESSPTSPRRK